MLDPEPAEIVRWMLLEPPNDRPIIVLVVEDAEDDEVTAVVAREDHVPSRHFGGLWGTAQRDGSWLIAFRLIELGGGIERTWVTDNLHRELLEAILVVPHLVAIMPHEIAGEAHTAAAVKPRLGGSLMVGVDERSPQVAKVLAERGEN
jgi:hypothetical protein